ncbi:MAG TPA: murein biosynthesis integral membrane protein MurJ [Steroidobacteraceae bacterium]|nr:murein biosynthesis integral membrane protein MurJ [Steroidobacteraceae bacterium]
MSASGYSSHFSIVGEPLFMSRRVFRSMSVFGLVTLLSRITGLWRDIVYASLFTALVNDAWIVAYQIPNFLRRLFAEGAFSQAFVPVVSQYRTQRNNDEVRELVDSVAGTLGGFLLVLSLIGSLSAPVLIWITASGFAAGTPKFDMAVAMLHWTFPYLFFVSMTALAGGVLNSYERFSIPAFSSVLLNIIMIIAALYVSPHMAKPYMALAFGVFVAGIAQVLIHLPVLLKLKLLRRPRWNLNHEGVRRIGKLMLPAIVGSSMGQISVLLSTSIATQLVDGSVFWLYSANRLVEFPLGVFSIGLATVILPSLSSHHAADAPDRFNAMLDWGLKILFVIVVPASVALYVLATPLTTTIFYHGKFTLESLRMTSWAVMAYSVALLAWSLVKVLAPGYFARQDTRTPVRTAAQAFGLNMILNIIALIALWLTGHLRDPGMHVLLATATAAGAVLNAWLLYRGLRKQNVYTPGAGWKALLLRVMIATALMALVLHFCSGDGAAWATMRNIRRVVWLTELVIGGAAVYFASLWLCGMRFAHLKHN